MKKTIIINLSGLVFHIDEDAYENLKRYLDSLAHFFGNTSEGKEIIADIEARFAELLIPKISDSKQSISIEDIDEILSILGTPEDIAGSATEPEDHANDYTVKSGTRRLYRDLDNSLIGGVSSGLGAYFGLDPLLFRILFIALIFAGGIGIITYTLLWIVVPAARTASQKLEMRGEDINIGTIERKVKEEFSNLKTTMGRPDSVWNRLGGFVHEVFKLLGLILKAVFGILRYFIGLFLILVAIIFSIAVIAALYFKNFSITSDFNHYYGSVQEFLYHLISPVTTDMLLLLIFIILVLPIAGLIYLGLKLIIRFKAQQKWIIIVLSVLWFISVFSFIVLVFNEIDNFKSESSIQKPDHFNALKGKTIYVQAISGENNGEYLSFYTHSRLFFPIGEGNTRQLAGVITVDVERSNATEPEILIIRQARGDHQESALVSVKKIQYNYQIQDSVVHLDPYFTVSEDEKWKFYHIRVVFRLPVGQKIYLDESLKYLLEDVENNREIWDQQMPGKTWVMTNNGLDLYGAENTEVHLLQDIGNKVLNLQLRDHLNIEKDKFSWYRQGDVFGNIHVNGQKLYYGTIRLDIKKAENDQTSIELIRKSSGDNSVTANKYSNAIEYTYEQKDSVIWLDPVFCFPGDQSWNNQQLIVVVRLPFQKRIFINHDFEPMVDQLASDNNSWAGEFAGHTYMLTSDGLKKLDE